MLQPKYTMYGFNQFDRRGNEGVGFIKALRTLFTNNLPSILPELRLTLTETFGELHANHLEVNGIAQHEFSHQVIAKITYKVKTLARLSNDSAAYSIDQCAGFLRQRAWYDWKQWVAYWTDIAVASDRAFMKSALTFIEPTLMTAKAIRLMPEFLAQYIHPSRS